MVQATSCRELPPSGEHLSLCNLLTSPLFFKCSGIALTGMAITGIPEGVLFPCSFKFLSSIIGGTQVEYLLDIRFEKNYLNFIQIRLHGKLYDDMMSSYGNTSISTKRPRDRRLTVPSTGCYCNDRRISRSIGTNSVQYTCILIQMYSKWIDLPQNINFPYK